jgi:Fe-S oxidoreductase
MASYKAEFLSHYYEHHARPMSAYTMGWIHRWSRIAATAPWLANLVTQNEYFARIAKKMAGIAEERQFPPFASRPFTRNRRQYSKTERAEVVLWPDTFNNHFHPEVCEAALVVLEKAGFRVGLPPKVLCCGRPLYDYGFLTEAKNLLRHVIGVLRREIANGIPIVALEPSCAAVFRDELVNLFPNDPDALRLSQQTFLFSEFLMRDPDRHEFPRLSGRAMVQGHCHHKSVFTMDAEEEVLRRLGLDFEILDSGCCGMAGAFGFEKDHYDTSVRAAERVRLPRLRGAPDKTLIMADGFSCREQIRQLTGLHAHHLAEVLSDHLVDAVNHP